MDRIKIWLINAVVRLMALMPLGMSRLLGKFIGLYNLRFDSRMAKVTRENLTLCLPELDDSSRETLVRNSLIETGRTITETAAVWRRPYSWLRQRIFAVHNVHLLEDYIASQQGVLILAPHLGNWEVVGLHLSEFTRVTSLYQPSGVPGLDKLIRQCRQKQGAHLVPTNRRGVADLLKVLRQGGVSAILPDQVPDQDGSGIFAPFFGHPAFTITLAHSLISRTGCKALFVYAQRVPGGFHIVYNEPDPEIYDDDQSISVRALNRGVETCVRKIPEQYQWEYKRFKRRPAGEKKRYQFK